jgi:hypothetical protein
MRRTAAAALTTAFLALVALVPSAGAVDPPYICPQGFVPLLAGPIPPPGTDENENLIVCVKEANGQLVWHDDLLDQGV